jgi:NTE family protein
MLSDGGLYDNLGLEPVWKDSGTLLVSDGGKPFGLASVDSFLGTFSRYLDVVMRQTDALRKRWLVSGYLDGLLAGAYWGIANATTDYAGATRSGYAKPIATSLVAAVRTDLDAFTAGEIAVLENHGYLLADAAVRTYAPSLLPTPDVTPTPPHPSAMSESYARSKLAKSATRRVTLRSLL